MNELKSNLEKCLVENKNLNEFLIKQKQEFDLEVDELSTKVNLNLFCVVKLKVKIFIHLASE